ncbi:Oidioi.mRNA.OKI2018_I69.PAR.g8600.t1.cds [Oikopleura dioica]|uniref:Oidioi.mRNA.OKI2018_I69.PAR.g8600.t1.cds n=1 Tax=Oikopleura dioica TaxID=34765 RepID=A0ABN7RK69_OIKDI|nr:Oidioi.mRNA.OKI2018_I69.PAR.g8600.t1.cds [Oikopleura dioica]
MKSLFSQLLNLNNRHPKCIEHHEGILHAIHNDLQTSILIDSEVGITSSTTQNILAYVSYQLGYISSSLKILEKILQKSSENCTALLSLSYIYAQ